MIVLRIVFVLLLHFIWSTLNASNPPAKIRISGIRKGSIGTEKDAYQVVPNKQFSIQVFGKSLPKNGFFFTTATTCEDAYLPDNDQISTVSGVVGESFCSYATLTFPKGLPFNVSTSNYHLCHRKVKHKLNDFLIIRSIAITEEKYTSEAVILCCFCILMSAYSSGMTLGYMKFSIVELNTFINGGDASLAKRARRILRFRRYSNYLVVSFSLFSSVFTVLFTTNVEKMLNGAPNESILKIAVPAMISLIFAEMIPQAVCNSNLGFDLASGLWFVSGLIFIVTFPIAYPVSLVLERFLKRDVREVLTEEEKTCMIQNMAKNANEKVKTILENATTFTNKKVGELMIPISDVFMLSRSQKLNRSTILTLVEKGYTRVPVYDDKNRNTIVGLLNMKDLNLVTCDLSKEPPVKDVLRQLDSLKEENKKVKFEAKYVNIDMNAQLLLNQMRTGDFHFACVVKYMPYDSKVLGIITIEDILEELFGKIDENNERRVRSSVDERADNTVIGWCREAGTDEKYPLSFSQQLRVLQYLMAECQVLRSLDIGILKAKQLLSLDRIRIAKPKEKLELNEMFLVIWKGSVTIENILETFDQVVKVPSKRSSSKDTVSKERKAAVPALIIGKQLLNKLMKSLGSPFREVILEKDDVRQVTAITEVFYFKLRLEDLLNTINGCKMIKKNDKTLLGESLIQRLNSRQSTPVSTTPIQRSPSKSLEPKSPDEKIPLLKKD